MIQVTDEKELYLSHFADLNRAIESAKPAWLHSIRKSAIESFDRLGFPTVHDEEWRFTNVAPIVKTVFKLAGIPGHGISTQIIQPWLLGRWDSYRVVFVNGVFSEKLSSLKDLPKGMIVGGLSQVLNSQPEILERHLARHVRFEEEPFAALNTAFLNDGAFVYVPKGVAVPKPVHVLLLATTDTKGPLVAHPRALIIGESNSQVQLLESYAGLDSGIYFTNAVTEVVADENARIEHYRLQRESLTAYHVSTFQALLERDANVSNHSISLGGSLVRNHVNVVLNGEGGEATVNGFYLANGTQHIDNHTCIEHAKPHCNSFEVYKGILDGSARAVFNGRIIVRPDAQKTDSKQTNKNLILSEEALVNSNPQLEIYADDVKCTHGATIGQLDADSIFYLRSRGIDLDAARHLLTYAFASDLNNRINIEPLRAELEQILFSRLAEGRGSRD
jgi:Fe-S cluster assembly protein SufD